MRIFITFFSQSYLLLDHLKRVKTPHYSKVYGVLFSKGHLSLMLVTDVLTKLGKNSIFDVWQGSKYAPDIRRLGKVFHSLNFSLVGFIIYHEELKLTQWTPFRLLRVLWEVTLMFDTVLYLPLHKHDSNNEQMTATRCMRRKTDTKLIK